MSPAISGAIAGAIAVGFIQFCQWWFNRKSLKRSIARGLYYEIDNHYFLELGFDKDEEPNVVLINFQDIYYSSNIANVCKLFKENISVRIAFYYSKLRLANALQDMNEKLLEEIEKLSTSKDENDLKILQNKIKRRSGALESIRTINVPALYIREELLSHLKKGFKKDPSKIGFIDVPEKYKKWWKREIKNQETKEN